MLAIFHLFMPANFVYMHEHLPQLTFFSSWGFQILVNNRPLRASVSLLHQQLILRLVAPTVDQVTSYTMF